MYGLFNTRCHRDTLLVASFKNFKDVRLSASWAPIKGHPPWNPSNIIVVPSGLSGALNIFFFSLTIRDREYIHQFCNTYQTIFMYNKKLSEFRCAWIQKKKFQHIQILLNLTKKKNPFFSVEDRYPWQNTFGILRGRQCSEDFDFVLLETKQKHKLAFLSKFYRAFRGNWKIDNLTVTHLYQLFTSKWMFVCWVPNRSERYNYNSNLV